MLELTGFLGPVVCTRWFYLNYFAEMLFAEYYYGAPPVSHGRDEKCVQNSEDGSVLGCSAL
jgi:hypothetical protein